MGTDDQVDLAGGEGLAHGLRLSARKRGRQPCDAKRGRRTPAGGQTLQRTLVLLGQKLRRSHQRRLMRVRGRAHGSQKRHGRLSAPDVSLQQTVHGMGEREVGLDLGHDAGLRARQSEWQRRGRCVHALGPLRESNPGLALSPSTPRLEAEL